MFSRIRAITVAAVAAFAFAASPALAQSVSADPTYGSIRLASGFTPDPYSVSVRSGGSINAEVALGGACKGFIANAPDFDLYWTPGSGSLPLKISVDASADTTLIVNTPDGRWHCDDDGGTNGLNPSIVFQSPQGGLYDIWIGTYGNNAIQPATLSISELTSH